MIEIVAEWLERLDRWLNKKIGHRTKFEVHCPKCQGVAKFTERGVSLVQVLVDEETGHLKVHTV